MGVMYCDCNHYTIIVLILLWDFASGYVLMCISDKWCGMSIIINFVRIIVMKNWPLLIIIVYDDNCSRENAKKPPENEVQELIWHLRMRGLA